jgi:hypothetical protein
MHEIHIPDWAIDPRRTAIVVIDMVAGSPQRKIAR